MIASLEQVPLPALLAACTTQVGSSRTKGRHGDLPLRRARIPAVIGILLYSPGALPERALAL